MRPPGPGLAMRYGPTASMPTPARRAASTTMVSSRGGGSQLTRGRPAEKPGRSRQGSRRAHAPSPAPAGPAEYGSPVRGRQTRAGGPLMRGRQDDGVGISFAQHVDADAVTVDGYPDYLKPGGSRCREGIVTGRGVLYHESLSASGSQHLDKQSYALCVSGGD